MNENLLKLKNALSEWLVRNDLDLDTRFYSIEEWKLRNEDYLNDSKLVLVYEGGLYSLLNFGEDFEKMEELEDLFESFGYYFERGNAWNMGFYPIEGYDFSKPKGNYKQKLRDVRWTTKRDFIRKRADYKCEDCGSNVRIEIHHCYYIKDHEPWEYPYDAFRCLCQTCHELRSKSEIRMRAHMAKLTHSQVDKLREALDTAFYWFKPDAVLSFISNFKSDDSELRSQVEILLENKANRE